MKTILQQLRASLTRGTQLVGLLTVLTGGTAGWVFTSCSSEDGEVTATKVGQEIDIELLASARAMEDATTRGVTRGWTWEPPATFYNYGDLYESGGSTIQNYQNLSEKTIDVVLIKKNAEGTQYHGRLHYSPSTKLWKLSIPDVEPNTVATGEYYIYGYIPREAADGATIALRDGSTSYADGAVLTIQGMPSVMADACVILGAKEGFRTGTTDNYIYYDGEYTDSDGDGTYDIGEPRFNRLRPGYFSFKLTNAENAENFLFLLFDHLCSALNITVKIEDKYNQLRTIKLKKIHMKTANNDGITKKMNVVVTLKANDDGSDPIESIAYNATDTESTGGNVFSSAEGLELTTTAQLFLSHFMPQNTITLILTSTYDVYDKQGNMTRKDCTATNTIHLDQLVDRFTSAERGKRYTVNLTIKPTYLYVLSEPDLDNPTMEVE